jgi:hypothetical protein
MRLRVVSSGADTDILRALAAGWRRLVLLARMRPVAAPHQPLGRRLDESLRDLGRFRIVGRPDLAHGMASSGTQPAPLPPEE